MDIAFYKKILQEKQSQLQKSEKTNQDATQVVELDQSKVGRLSRMDALQAQAISLETKHRRQLEISKIKSALIRIKNNEFGDCLHCGEEIAEQRLTINPAATLCINCAEQKESKR